MMIPCQIKYFSAKFGCHRDIVTMTTVIHDNFKNSVCCHRNYFEIENSLRTGFLASKKIHVLSLMTDIKTILLSAKMTFTIKLSDLLS